MGEHIRLKAADGVEIGPFCTIASMTARWENCREMRRDSFKARSLIRSITELNHRNGFMSTADPCPAALNGGGDLS